MSAIDDIEMLRISGPKADKAILILTRLLEDESVAVRIKAARTLFDLDQPVKNLLPAAVSGLKDTDPDNRVSASCQ